MILADSTEAPAGCVVHAEPGEALADLDARRVRDLLAAHGAILFRGFELDVGSFAAFAGRFVARHFIHGGAREQITPDDTIQTAEVGTTALDVHCEMAYTPLRPDLCFFGCDRASPHGGETRVADGAFVLARLSPETRRLMETTRIRYVREYSKDTWRRSLKVSSIAELEARLASFEGVTYRIREDTGAVFLDTLTAAIVSGPSGKPAFANSLTSLFDQARGRFPYTMLEDGRDVPPDVVDEIRRELAGATFEVAWRKHDVLMLDNWRVMHGRNAFPDASARRLFATFGYVPRA